MRSIHVVGIGLEGVAGWNRATLDLVRGAAIVLGSRRHLALIEELRLQGLPETWILGDLGESIDRLQQWQRHPSAALGHPRTGAVYPNPSAYGVVLTSGDPLFFGLGRLLLETLPAHSLHFHPHFSSIQLAFSRLKLPWQDVHHISVHGRDLEAIIPPVQRGVQKLAILTDPVNDPGVIAQLLLDLDLPQSYTCHVCENLGGSDERLTQGTLQEIAQQRFAALSVLVLLANSGDYPATQPKTWPLLGIPDSAFASFADRPGLITKREIRVQILSELALMPPQVIWDIGAGTGSVAIEIARLCPQSTVYAIEKTAAGVGLIQTNCDRFQVDNIQITSGQAPQDLEQWPRADRIFIGGSGGNLGEILDFCGRSLQSQGRIVLALATLEHQAAVQSWLQESGLSFVHVQWRQVQIDRSASFAHLTRYIPLNPVTLVTIQT